MSMLNEPRVLVCVTGQKSCERLIEEGASIALEHNIELSVVHVAKTGNNFLGSTSGVTEAEALEYLFGISKNYDADMALLRSDDVSPTIVSYARKMNAAVIVIGSRPTRGGNHLTRTLQNSMPDLDIRTIVTEEV